MDGDNNGARKHTGAIHLIDSQPRRAAVSMLSAIVRQLDEDGTYEPEQVVMGHGGQSIAIPARHDFVDAEELATLVAEAVRKVIREELAATK